MLMENKTIISFILYLRIQVKKIVSSFKDDFLTYIFSFAQAVVLTERVYAKRIFTIVYERLSLYLLRCETVRKSLNLLFGKFSKSIQMEEINNLQFKIVKDKGGFSITNRKTNNGIEIDKPTNSSLAENKNKKRKIYHVTSNTDSSHIQQIKWLTDILISDIHI